VLQYSLLPQLPSSSTPGLSCKDLPFTPSRSIKEWAEEWRWPPSDGTEPQDNPDTQNHRMFGVGRDLWGSPSPTPCQSRVTYSRLHRTLFRRGLSISREGDSTTSLGSLGQGSVTLRVKKFFLLFSWSFLCFSLCPLPLVLSLGTTGKSLAPHCRGAWGVVCMGRAGHLLWAAHASLLPGAGPSIPSTLCCCRVTQHSGCRHTSEKASCSQTSPQVRQQQSGTRLCPLHQRAPRPCLWY